MIPPESSNHILRIYTNAMMKLLYTVCLLLSQFNSVILQHFHLTHAHACTHTCTNSHTHAHTHAHAHMHTLTHTCTHSHTHTHTHTQISREDVDDFDSSPMELKDRVHSMSYPPRVLLHGEDPSWWIQVKYPHGVRKYTCAHQTTRHCEFYMFMH